jgi:2-oxoglutarate ferredoxin oxidoreductase subunit gamma
MKPFKIIIAGEGGQGVQSIAKIIAYAAFMQGLKAVYVPYFSTEKRGGVTEAWAQVGDTAPSYPKFTKADLWVAMSQRAVDRIFGYLKDDTKVIVNSFLVTDTSRVAAWKPTIINAGKIAKEELKKPRTFNMVIMGAMVKQIPGLDKTKFFGALEKQFKSKYEKDPSLKELNERAFEIGYGLG